MRLSETPTGIHRHAPFLGGKDEDVFQGLLCITTKKLASLKAEEVIY